MQSLKSFLNLIHFPTRNLQTIFHRSLHGIHHCFNPTSFLLMLQFLNYSIPTVTVSHSLLTIYDSRFPSPISFLPTHYSPWTIDCGPWTVLSCILYLVSWIVDLAFCIPYPILWIILIAPLTYLLQMGERIRIRVDQHECHSKASTHIINNIPLDFSS